MIGGLRSRNLVGVAGLVLLSIALTGCAAEEYLSANPSRSSLVGEWAHPPGGARLVLTGHRFVVSNLPLGLVDTGSARATSTEGPGISGEGSWAYSPNELVDDGTIPPGLELTFDSVGLSGDSFDLAAYGSDGHVQLGVIIGDPDAGMTYTFTRR